MLVEHARNLLGITDASHRESTEEGTPIVSLLACSLADDSITVTITPGTRTARLYGSEGHTAVERTTCNYGLNPAYAHVAREGGMVVTAIDDTDEVRAIERDDHPFFLATLFQPQLSSTPAAPHPLLRGFVEACG